MKINVSSISLKLGLLFSGIFMSLFLILGLILYMIFTHFFVDYIKQDLLARGNNHAAILGERFDQQTITHVIAMEKGVKTAAIITDSGNRILASSVKPDLDMNQHFIHQKISVGRIVESDWQKHDYIIAVSPIKKGAGYVYMYYPAGILREFVLVLTILVLVASLGIMSLGLGLIGLLSQRLTKPLLLMKEASNEMALGKYKQRIPVKGTDELAQLGNSIQSLGEQLQSFEDSRNEFLAAVSHELRTPLTYIKGYSDILMKNMIQNPIDQQNYLNIINKEASRVALLVNDLFEMSKLQVGQFELNTELTEVNHLIEAVAMNLRPEAEKKGLELKVECGENLPPVRIDVKRMEQVFYNLLENAIKYTDHGSVSVRAYSNDEFVVTEILDSGIGIGANELPKLWDRFYRVDQSRTRKKGGSGLGLYVAKQIAESHHGKIAVSSVPGKGTVFTVYVPFFKNADRGKME